MKYALEKFEEDQLKFSHLDPNQVDRNGDSLFHLVAKAKFNNMVFSATELLYKHKLSSSMYNNEEKLPSFYIKKQNDRRLPLINLAAQALPKTSGPKTKTKTDYISSANQSNDGVSCGTEGQHKIKEVVTVSTQREIRKKKIEESIRLLPDRKVSIFNLDASPTKQGPDDKISENDDYSMDEKDKGEKMVKKSLLTELQNGQSEADVENSKTQMKGEQTKGQDQSMTYCQVDDLDNGQGENVKKDNVDVDRQAMLDQVPKSGSELPPNYVIGIVDGDRRCDDVTDAVIESEESDPEDTEEEFDIDVQVNLLFECSYIRPLAEGSLLQTQQTRRLFWP